MLLVGFFSTAQSYSKNLDFNNLILQFDDASSDLKEEYIPLLYLFADTLKKTPSMHVTIRGHVCCVKRNRLAKKRAAIVYDYLLLFGVNSKQLTKIGMKNSIPVIFPEKSKKDELANMRVDFVIRKD